MGILLYWKYNECENKILNLYLILEKCTENAMISACFDMNDHEMRIDPENNYDILIRKKKWYIGHIGQIYENRISFFQTKKKKRN